MSWTNLHEKKIDALETVIKVLKNGKRLNDYAALEAGLQAMRVIALAKGHGRSGPATEECPGEASGGDCPVCQSVIFIEAALQAINPDPQWKPRLDPDMPRIVIPGGA